MIAKLDHLESSKALEQILKWCFGNEDGIQMESIVISLKCPLSFGRMKIPCRTSACKHVQCFDFKSFISYLRQKRIFEDQTKWQCPICKVAAPLAKIYVDEYLREIVDDPKATSDRIKQNLKGWTTAEETRRELPITTIPITSNNLIIIDHSNKPTPPPPPRNRLAITQQTIDLTADDYIPIKPISISNTNSVPVTLEQAILQLQKIQQESKCIICMDQPKSVDLIPCGHACLCVSCAANIEKCPICRSQISYRHKIFNN